MIFKVTQALTIRIHAGNAINLLNQTNRVSGVNGCDIWFHSKCHDITTEEYISLANSSHLWLCKNCALPFSLEQNISLGESFSNFLDSDDSLSDENAFPEYYKKLREMRINCPHKLIITHLNINSLRNKSYEIHDLLQNNYIDILVLSETKLNESFPDPQFAIPNYRLFRRDRNGHGGGLIAYIRSDIPCRRLTQLESKSLETIVVELKLKTENWILVSCYRPPNLPDSVFTKNITTILDKSSVKTDNILVLGDLNYNLLDNHRHGRTLSDINDIFDMSCLLSKPTCFKGDQGTLLDVFLTNRPKKFYRININ